MSSAGPNAVEMRRPEHARLVTPDVMLHALHKYFENSLEYLERFELAPLLRRFLYQAQARALECRGRSEGVLAERFEMVAAQLTVPLVILENAQWSISYEERLKSNQDFQDLTDKPDITESLEGALKRLGKYQKQFSPEVFGRMGQEIKNIYQAAGVSVSPLYGQYAEAGEIQTDYTQFTPRSHYAKSSLSAGLFSGHDVFREKQLSVWKNPPAFPMPCCWSTLWRSPGATDKPIVKDWQKIMEITTFYAGYPDDIWL